VVGDAQEIVDMPQDGVDELFRSSAAGDIPSGEAEGTVIFHPGTHMADVAEKLAHLIVWQGKVFDADNGNLVNKVTPLHVDAIKGKVYKGESWFDGKEAIILDYSKTSLIAHYIRDEMRLVGDGLDLGIVYWGHERLLNFALQFPKPS
jgi:hypothetical protein